MNEFECAARGSAKRAVIVLFVVAECAVYLALQFFFTPLLRYATVLIPFALSLFSLRRGGEALIPLALMTTMAADYFFVLCVPPRKTVAVLLFIIVQTLYCLRIHRELPLRAKGFLLAARGALGAGILLFSIRVGMRSFLLIAAALYFPNLLANAIEGVLVDRREPIVFGLILFLLCDLCVGLSYLFETGLFVPNESLEMGVLCKRIAWAFYPPSQLLISLTAFVGSRNEISDAGSFCAE